MTMTTKPCNCKKSKCLKLYCECFANNKYCGPSCACKECNNLTHCEQSRINARQQILQRNPQAFRVNKLTSENGGGQSIACDASSVAMSDVVSKDGVARHFKGCNCLRSHCKKNYCECHQAGVPCSELCNCQECHNIDENHDNHKRGNN